MVVSIDPKRVYVREGPGSRTEGPLSLREKTVVRLGEGDTGPNGETFCWWQATVKGGREVRDIDAVQLAKVLHSSFQFLYFIYFVYFFVLF